MEINEVLKELRQRKHLTQQELATALDINLSSYQKYERPNNTIKPSIDALIKIADYYHVTVDYLLGREPAPPPVDPFEALGLKKSVDDDEFIRLYSTLPDFAKQIFVDTMAKLAQATSDNLQKKSTRPQQPVEPPPKPDIQISQITNSELAIARGGKGYKPAPTDEQFSKFVELTPDMLGEELP